VNRAGSRSGLSILLIALILFACSLSGLAAGVYARSLAHRDVGGTSGPSSHGSHATSASHTPAPTATSTVVPTAVAAAGFTLTLTADPNVSAPGGSFTATVVATSASGSPVAGLTCYLRAPEGMTPLYDQWPPAQVTSAQGIATWHLKAPQVSPGLYGIEVVAYGANGYHWSYRVHFTVSGNS
jgi:hypothetical protein